MREENSLDAVRPPRLTLPRRPKPYLSAQELAELTPWSEQAIKDMMRAGKLREGVHYFHVGRRVLFKWDAIVELIEHNGVGSDANGRRGATAGEDGEACARAARRTRFTRRADAQGEAADG